MTDTPRAGKSNRHAFSNEVETVTPSKGKGACEPAWSCLWGAEKRRAPGRARAKTRAFVV